ncbi:MAG: lysoplasmalogenase family protein [Microbacterium sp.]|uniref:lysoplasmalogenase family protein n=1 Tax=Microbacterium sp. TaxID=51671 RepID=UPI003F951755
MPRSIPFRPLLLWSFLPYIVVSVVHVGALAAQSDIAAPTKLWLMPLLALPVIISLRLRPVLAIVLLFVAIVFSWLGDGAGAFFPGGPELPLMLLFFGLAHIAYIVLFARILRVQKMPWWALVYAAWWIATLVVLGAHTGPLLVAVAGYGLVLGGTAVFATRCHPLVIWGSIFFLTSDTVLAFRLFMSDAMPQWTSPLVMLTYTLGQGLIVAGALATLRARKAQ